MVTVRIKDHVQQASTYDDGQVIFRLIAEPVKDGDVVDVSFDGIQAVPSAFVNAAFLQLLEVAPIERVRASLRITHSTKFINELIRSRFNFVSRRTPHSA